MTFSKNKKIGRCPACNYPDEELISVTGLDAEVDEMCADCLHEWEYDDVVYHCWWCDGHIIDENTKDPQRFCDEKCEAQYQRGYGQIRLFTETAFGLAVSAVSM